MRYHATAVFALAFVLSACGRADDGEGDFEDGIAAEAEAEEVGYEGQPETEATVAAVDSIPMQIAVALGSIPNGPTALGAPAGTFNVSDNGSLCIHNPDAQVGQTVPEWSVIYVDEQQPEIGSLRLMTGKTTGGSTDRMDARFVHRAQPHELHQIATWAGGAQAGRATARAQRQGEGVRIEVDGETGLGRKIQITVVCERLGDVW